MSFITNKNFIFYGVIFLFALLFMLLITSKSSMYGKRDYYNDHPNSSKSYEQWTQEREYVNGVN